MFIKYLCDINILFMECKKCKIDKPLTEFYKANNKFGYERTCKTCRNARKYELRRKKRIEEGLEIKFSTMKSRELLNNGKKYCPSCETIKNIDEFSTMKVRNGIASHCKECNRQKLQLYYNTKKGKEAKKNSYLKNKIRLKNNKLIRNFGITYDEYIKILNQQNGKCVICGKTEKENGKMLAVDHDHNTNKVRELLCASCNLVVGFIEKNDLNFKNIENYLLKHKI